MKKPLLMAAALLITAVSFGQKKEIKKAQKAFTKGDVEAAKTYLGTAEGKLGAADTNTKIDFYLAKGEITLADAGKTDYAKMKEAAAAFMKAKELDTANDYGGAIDNGVTNTRVALVNSAVKDQKLNPSLASEKLYLSYQVKKDTSDLYFAAGNSVNAKDYDKGLEYYLQLLDMGYTGIKKEYTAVKLEDGSIATFASEADRNSEMISGKYTKPGERMSKSAKGDILRSVVLIYSSKGENDKAIELMKQARKENPDDISLVRAEADMVYKMGDMVRYNELMEQVLASDPTNPELHFNLGVAAANNGNTSEAMKYYKSAIEINPDYDKAQINIARLLLSEEGAIVEAMNSLGTSKADYKKYDELSAKKDGLYSQAMPYLEAALKTRGDNVELVRTLMNIYSQLGMDAKFAEMKSKLSSMEGN